MVHGLVHRVRVLLQERNGCHMESTAPWQQWTQCAGDESRPRNDSNSFADMVFESSVRTLLHHGGARKTGRLALDRGTSSTLGGRIDPF